MLLPPGTPGGTVGSVGTVGGRNTPGEPVSLLNEKGAKLVLFVLRQHGPLFPKEITDLTGKTHGAVKKIVSELRTAGEVRDTGKKDEHGSRQVAWVEPHVEGELADIGFGAQLDGRLLKSHDENEERS